MKFGDIIRYTRIQNRDLEQPGWAVVTQVRPDGWLAKAIFGPVGRFREGEYIPIVSRVTSNAVIREVFDPEDAPDEYCVLLAKRALLNQ